jgi:HlyD family secretion protein
LAALNEVFSALRSCYSALENSMTSSAFTSTDLNALKTGISTHQTTIAAAVSAVEAAKQNLDNALLAYDTSVNNAANGLIQAQAAYDNAVIAARNGLASARVTGAQTMTAAESRADNAFEAWRVAQTQLDKITAPANKYDVTLARARIAQAQAALDAINKQIENCRIKAPISGTITQVNYEVGEQVLTGQTAIAMLGQNNFEIEVLISEADISKIKNDNPAEITLDAFGDDVKFDGRVYFIEPAETVIQDVIYYKVKISFDPQDMKIKSGMTANAIITTARQDNVLVMPGRAIIEKNGKTNGGALSDTPPAGPERYVRILVGGQVQESPVTVGLRGDEGLVEALSGVKEGDKVITYIKEK